MEYRGHFRKFKYRYNKQYATPISRIELALAMFIPLILLGAYFYIKPATELLNIIVGGRK